MIMKNDTQGNYVIVSQTILHDAELGMFDRGLLSTLISLPNNWDFTIEGLAAIVKDGKDALKAGIKRLRERGYLVIEQLRENGRFSGNCLRINVDPHNSLADNSLMEKPSAENPSTVNQSSVKPLAEKPTQLSNDISNTYELTKDISTTTEELPIAVDATALFADLNLADEDIRAIVSAAGNDLVKCSEALEVLKRQSKPVNNVVGWLIKAVKEGYRVVPLPEPYRSGVTDDNGYGMKQREYDYDELERLLVQN